MKKHIPNAVTLFNLFCGCGALVNLFYGDFIPAFWFLLAGTLADYSDGLVARRLGVSSPLGKELDSLADMVSFGVAPGAIYYVLLVKGWYPEGLPGRMAPEALPAFTVSVFAGLRLGMFNVDDRQTDTFLGLPTPSATVFAVGLMLIHHFDSFGLGNFVTNPLLLYGCILVISWLMVSEVPMFSLKFNSRGWAGNEVKYIFAGMTVVLLLVLREASLSVVILLYILFSLIQYRPGRRG